MKELNKEDLRKLYKLKDLTVIKASDVIELQKFMVIHIDARVNICKSCPTQIRFAFQRFGYWVTRYLDKFPIELEDIEVEKEYPNVEDVKSTPKKKRGRPKKKK